MKRNSRFLHKNFCRRKICFMFLGPLCVLISFSGAAAGATLLRLRACSHQMSSVIPSILSFWPMWVFTNHSVQQTLSILVAVLPTTQPSPDTCLFHFPPEEKRVQQLSVLHLLMCKCTQTLPCVCLKASNDGNLSCNATGAKETCGENFIWYFGSRLQNRSISWMPQL